MLGSESRVRSASLVKVASSFSLEEFTVNLCDAVRDEKTGSLVTGKMRSGLRIGI